MGGQLHLKLAENRTKDIKLSMSTYRTPQNILQKYMVEAVKTISYQVKNSWRFKSGFLNINALWFQGDYAKKATRGDHKKWPVLKI